MSTDPNTRPHADPPRPAAQADPLPGDIQAALTVWRECNVRVQQKFVVQSSGHMFIVQGPPLSEAETQLSDAAADALRKYFDWIGGIYEGFNDED